MGVVEALSAIWSGTSTPFLIRDDSSIGFQDLNSAPTSALEEVRPGDVVALIGDFDPSTISLMLRLIDRGAILMPLTVQNRADHEYFFDSGQVDLVIEAGVVRRLRPRSGHALLESLRAMERPGLILFSTGSTGRPKAILHDFTLFLRRFEEPRPTLRTLAFLLFDHIGGINTLFHALFNRGVVTAPRQRSVAAILETCRRFSVEVLPTTPTFLRMLLISGALPDAFPPSVRIVTYGTERMDEPTLLELCRLLPDVDFRQTFGMSELGILRVKSEARDSLFMRVGGQGVETRVVDNILHIRSATRMLGYLNAPSPFDGEGWYDTGDVVVARDDMFKVVGRAGDVINVGGLKFLPSDVETAALGFPDVALVKATARANPVTGQHVELAVEPVEGADFSPAELGLYLRSRLSPHQVPQRIRIGPVAVGHRFKRS